MTAFKASRYASFLFVLAIVLWCGNIYLHPWQNIDIGDGHYAVRRNRMIDQIEIRRDDGTWHRPFQNDAYATPLTPDDLKRVSIRDVTWGPTGLLCARVLAAPGPPIKGRLAFRIVLRDSKRFKQIRERFLRATVDWPAGTLTPIVIRTGLSDQYEPNIATDLTVVPTTYNGE